MKEGNGAKPKAATPFEKFKDLTDKLLKVPKDEVAEKDHAYQRKKAARRRKKSKPA